MFLISFDYSLGYSACSIPFSPYDVSNHCSLPILQYTPLYILRIT